MVYSVEGGIAMGGLGVASIGKATTAMLTQLVHGLELHVRGIPAWMQHMNPDKMTSKQKSTLVSPMHSPRC